MTTTANLLESRTREIGLALWRDMQDARPGLFARDFWASKLLDRTMEDAEFKLDLFRLVDVLPSLRSAEEINAHLQEYLARPGRKLPTALSAALHLTGAGLVGRLAGSALRAGVTEMAERFIVGATPKDALPTLRRMHREGFRHTVDLLGEATLSGREADAYQQRYLDLIDALSKETEAWNSGETPLKGPLANISIKLSALEPHLDAVDPRGSIARVRRRVEPILTAAQSSGVFVNFDIEQYALHEITYGLFEELANSDTFRAWPHLGIVVQAYCTRAEAYLERLHALADKRGAPITVRLVKGAYWDFEVIQADQHGHAQPVFGQKAETDAHFERLSTWLIDRRDMLPPALGTHNLRSVAHALACAEAAGADPASFEIQTLHGMAEPMREALRRRGHRVRVYSPVGDLLHGMAYLVRRLLENTANESFLRMTYHDGTDVVALLADPAKAIAPGKAPAETAAYRNCPHADFADSRVQSGFARAVDSIHRRLPFEVPVVIDGEDVRPREPVTRPNPADTREAVSRIHYATADLAARAVKSAADAWPAWRDTPLSERVGLLQKLADTLERDREQLAAMQVFEVAKPWREADADVTEAIDFCRYYAHGAPIELGIERLGNVRGETNDLWYEGRGPAAIIAPWNFPMAILCGMSVAALVAGNTVIMKPAEQSSAIAYALFQRMQEAGFPPGAVQFLPGRGEEIGAFLVDHPDIAQVAFTGSKAVGLKIVERAAKTQPGQRQVKRVVCEMGGKNAIVVDADADLDEAVAGIVYSAFGYAGQKCSACSRVIAVGDAYDPLVERLVAACADLVLGPPRDPACQMPPVVDEEAHLRLMDVIASPGDGARRLFVGSAPSGGWYVPPALFEVADSRHRLMQEELFGPVVALMRTGTFETALEIANATEFALTGAVFTRRPSHLELAQHAFRVGNLYLNRGCTGSMVGRQAFGGFHMSGIGLKAGGPGYLRQFADPRSVTENMTRRGFSPDVSL